ncbi:MAG: hypothetical protein ACF8PN_11380 [Phycisphaerales bacterium]
MSQMQTGMQRRSARPVLDVYAALSLAGTFALIVAVAVLWMAGTDLAGGELPFTIIGR